MNEERLADEQGRALQTHSGVGALYTPTYRQRKQEFVAVNRHDLEDMKAFDGVELFLLGVGNFFFSGATWLGVDKYLSSDKPELSPVLIACLLSIIFGLVMMAAGVVIRFMKRRKITRIFTQAE